MPPPPKPKRVTNTILDIPYDSKYATTTVTTMPAQKRIAFQDGGSYDTSNSNYQLYQRTITSIMDWNDGSAPLPCTSNVLATDYSTSGDSADKVQVALAVPPVPDGDGSRPLTVCYIIRTGAMKWDLEKSPAELSYAANYFGVALNTTGSGSSTSWESGYHNMFKAYGTMTLGHTHPFRIGRTQIFTSKLLDQSASATGTSNDDAFHVEPRNNVLLLVQQMDMADPNAKYGRHISGILWTDGLTSRFVTPESMRVITSFEPYETTLAKVMELSLIHI